MSAKRFGVLAGSLFSLVIFSFPAWSAEPQADKEMQQVLSALQQLGAKPIAELSPQQARKQPTPADAVKQVLQKQGKSTKPQPVAKVENRTIQAPDGDIPIRIYWPNALKGGALPVVHYIHGGGWVIADLDVYDASPRAIANAANAIVVSSHYRQAPEHKFPAAHEDSFAAYRWVLDNAKSLGGDPQAVAVMGESAGGNMALAISLMAKQKNVLLPVHQVLVYPVVQYGDFSTPSYEENAQAKPLDKAAMEWFFKHYLQSENDGDNPMLSLLKADLSNLPPATIITAEIDPLRSEGQALTGKLKDAGVRVDYRNYDGVTHEFFGMGAVVPDAKAAVSQAARGLRRSFETIAGSEHGRQPAASGATR